MNIKRTSLAIMFGLFVLSTQPAVAATNPVAKEFDYYINAALKVYIDTIPPSINTSEIFLNYMEKKWRQKQCSTQYECQNLGVRVAHEFASNYNT